MKKILRDDRNQPIKNSPKITEDSYETIPGEFGENFGRWATLIHRRNTLANPKDNTKGWLNIMDSRGRVSCDPRYTRCGNWKDDPQRSSKCSRNSCCIRKGNETVLYRTRRESPYRCRCCWCSASSIRQEL